MILQPPQQPQQPQQALQPQSTVPFRQRTNGPGQSKAQTVSKLRRNPLWRGRRFLFVLGVFGMFGVGAVASMAVKVELFEDDFENLKKTTYVCTADVQSGCDADSAADEWSFDGQERTTVPYEDMPDVLIEAVVATEDRRYWDHNGVDPKGVGRAFYQVGKNKVSGSTGLQGGSTITQQYIKVASKDAEKDVFRKFREMVRAIKFEQDHQAVFGEEYDPVLMSQLGEDLQKEAVKQEIIERYLNRISFGRRSNGVEAASRAYFNKSVTDLTLPEAAYLAGLIRSPETADASTKQKEATRRRDESLKAMALVGYITDEERDAAMADDWSTLVPRGQVTTQDSGDSTEPSNAKCGSEYLVRKEVRNQLEILFPGQEYFTQGYQVYTTLDPTLQCHAYQTVTESLDPANPDLPLGSIVSIDERGRVVAMMGGADFGASEVNLATASGGSGFQPGSTFKTFVLAEFYNQGYSPDSLFAVPHESGGTATFVDQSGAVVKKSNGQPYEVKGGARTAAPFHRDVNNSFLNSSNIPFVQMSLLVEPKNGAAMANRLGVEGHVSPTSSMVLGTGVFAPLDIAAGYRTLANGGTRIDPVIIDRIDGPNGEVICYRPRITTTYDASGEITGTESSCPKSGEPIVLEGTTESVAKQVNYGLKQVVAQGTGKNAAVPGCQVAGKTGTTQNYRDAMFVGSTSNLTTAVWVGFPGVVGEEPRYMTSGSAAARALNGGKNVTGGAAAKLWSSYTRKAVKHLSDASISDCGEIPSSRTAGNQRKLNQELLTTLLPCKDDDNGDGDKDTVTSQNNGGTNNNGNNGNGRNRGNGGDAGQRIDASYQLGGAQFVQAQFPFTLPNFFEDKEPCLENGTPVGTQNPAGPSVTGPETTEGSGSSTTFDPENPGNTTSSFGPPTTEASSTTVDTQNPVDSTATTRRPRPTRPFIIPTREGDNTVDVN